MSQNIKNDFKVELSGVLSWALLSFSIVKLSLIYSSHPILIFLITYNICSIIFLLFFFGFYKERHSFIKHIRLTFFYNVAMLVYDILYNELILIYKTELSYKVAAFIAIFVFNLFLSAIFYFVFKKLRKLKTN